MRLFTAGLATETNTLSPLPTGEGDFIVVRGGAPDDASLFGAPLVAFRKLARARGFEVREGLYAYAEPAGPVVRAVYERLRDEILGELERAMPVDAVLLSLHGAMVADGYDDCEGDLLARVRRVVGPSVPVGGELDPHCHLTNAMLENATALVCFKQYPHVDFEARALDLFRLIEDAALGRTRPRMSTFDCRMIGGYHTTLEPMKGFVEKITALEGQGGVLSISVAHGFPWGDVPEAGTKLLVITDDQAEEGARLASELGRALYALRGRTHRPVLGVDEALTRALRAHRGPVVLGDVSDNPGGGAPGDATFLLEAVLARGVSDVALGCIWDPVAVSIAASAGEGARLDLRIGGKLGPMSGRPVDLRVLVSRVGRDVKQSFAGAQNSLGDAVAVRAAGVDVVLCSARTQVLSPDCFTKLGIEPSSRRLLIVKSSQHYRAGFADVAAEIHDVGAPGAIQPDFASIPLRRIARPKWPFDPDPLGLGGEP
jgi:microcystin degradation protein MlrC